MIPWLVENLTNILLIAALLAVVTAIVVYLYRRRRSGKSACGCSCASCPMKGKCHAKQQ